jgi:tetratricopeptide (TPR) repeat protein
VTIRHASPRYPTGVLLALALPLMLVAAVPVRGAGTPGAADDIVGAERSVDEAARDYYAEEEQAARAGAADRTLLLQEARARYRMAAAAQGKALKLRLDHYQAANELGYALRRAGDAQKAIGAYNLALSIKPDFLEAIEYRGEAYLALGRFDAAKAAYLTLFRSDADLAARLLAAMLAITDAPDDFKAWAAERRELATLSGFTADPENAWSAPVTPLGAAGHP